MKPFKYYSAEHTLALMECGKQNLQKLIKQLYEIDHELLTEEELNYIKEVK